MKNIKVFVITHKNYNFPKKDGYVPLLVGVQKKLDYANEYYKDNTGINISEKNGNYCELTGLYWIWKNKLEEQDIIGLEHYRRYFFRKKYTNNYNFLLNKEDIEKILNNYDIMLPQKKYTIDGNNYLDYKEHHHIKDLELCRKIIEGMYPSYLDSFDKIMKKNYLYPFNMFIMSSYNVNNFCQWLFEILSEVEKRTDIREYDNYNKRIFGFLSERLFNVWIEKNNLKIKNVYVKNVEEANRKEDIQNSIKFIIVKSPLKRIVAKRVSKLRKRKK